MPEPITQPVRVEAAGEPPKLIDEFAGRASNGEQRVSVARMRSPAGWSEPGQRPEFAPDGFVVGAEQRRGGADLDRTPVQPDRRAHLRDRVLAIVHVDHEAVARVTVLEHLADRVDHGVRTIDCRAHRRLIPDVGAHGGDQPGRALPVGKTARSG